MPQLKKDQKYYTFYYLDGSRELAIGISFWDAFQNVGNGLGRLRELDFVIPGIDDGYIWANGYWAKKAPAELE